MYFKLNKKIIYSLLCLMVLLLVMLFIIFINLYSQKLQDNQSSVYIRNQYVVSLLYDKLRLQQQLARIAAEHPEAVTDKSLLPSPSVVNTAQRELSNEQKLNEEFKKNYDTNREAIITGAKIVGISMLFVIFFVFLLLFLLDYWVIIPVEKLIKISNKVSAGVFSDRLKIRNNSYFKDEFDILFATFNKMLDNIEQNIETIKLRGRFLQQLTDTVPDGIRVIDRDFNVITANKAFHKILGLKSNCTGKKCYDAYGYGKCGGCPASRFDCPVRYFKEHTEDLHVVHEVGKLPLYVNAARLLTDKSTDENDYYIVEAIHDLRGDVRFSHQQKVSSLAFLSTSIAHEMKNNLGAIRLILEGVLETDYKDIPDDNQSKKYLTMAYRQLVETVKTPERLLKLARYSETDYGYINLYSAINDVMLMTDYEAKRRGISTETDVDSGLALWGNEADFKMIILNLVQNAVKAMQNGGSLTVSGHKKASNAVISVKDTGTGINKEQIKHIFEPFYSAGRSKSSGLGLAIVSSLVEKMNGTISVKSKRGKGSEFTIKIPLAKKEKANQASPIS